MTFKYKLVVGLGGTIVLLSAWAQQRRAGDTSYNLNPAHLQP